MTKKLKNKKKHLQKEERFCIEKMLGQNKSFGEIARTLGRGLSTISEEVNGRDGREHYHAQKANHRAYLKQYWKKKNCNKVALDGHLSRFVEKSLGKGWSPETISCRLEIQSGLKYASPKSIRKFIDRRPSLERFLFWERNKMKSGRKRKKDAYLNDPDRKWIEARPSTALSDYGHWEGDFIVSKHNSSVLLVLVEKYSKKILLAVLPSRNNTLINGTIATLLLGQTVSSLTFDNDIAFLKWKQLEEKLNTKIYFCHPYHSWEKGLVENTNRWIREFVPKKSNLALFSKEDIRWIEDWFNHTPKECLNGKTAYEVSVQKEYGMMVESVEINLPRLRIWG
ncbi:MAG: IS30 family transposase [bacterium]|nr:IS30 family transposase [bacterium]